MAAKTELVTQVEEIGRYGAAVFSVTADQFYGAGFASGDIVRVCINNKEYVVPVGTSYSDVDTGELILLKIEFEKRMLLALSYCHGFAEKNGVRVGDHVRIAMEVRGGYRKEYELRSVSMGTDRKDYPSDEAFCNFRAVKAGRLRENYLYRGFSPINPMENRAELTDSLLARTEVKTVINLDGEGPEERSRYAGYADSYYAGLNIVPLKVSFSAGEGDFAENMRKFIRILNKEDGPFYIHCRFGRDRTGLLCMVLEGLCEASLTELMDDYMLSFENIHGLKKHSEKWELQLRKKGYRAFEELTGVYPEGELDGKEVASLMEKRLVEGCGVSKEEIEVLKKKFCG